MVIAKKDLTLSNNHKRPYGTYIESGLEEQDEGQNGV